MSETDAKVEQPEHHASRRHISRLRPRRLNVWYTDAEYELVQEAAALCGKPTNVFVRAESLGRRLKGKPWLANAELVRELSKCGMALKHLADTARETGALPVADTLEKALCELRALLRQIADARPARAAQRG